MTRITITGINTRTNKSTTWTLTDHGLRGNGCHLVETARGSMYWLNPVRRMLIPHTRRGTRLTDVVVHTSCDCTAEVPCLDHVEARSAAAQAKAPVHFDL